MFVGRPDHSAFGDGQWDAPVAMPEREVMKGAASSTCRATYADGSPFRTGLDGVFGLRRLTQSPRHYHVRNQ
jgi:hypothetical protein